MKTPMLTTTQRAAILGDPAPVACSRGLQPRHCEALGSYTLADLHASFAAALARRQARLRQPTLAIDRHRYI